MNVLKPFRLLMMVLLGLFSVQHAEASIFPMVQDTAETDTNKIKKAENELPMEPGRVVEFSTDEAT